MLSIDYQLLNLHLSFEKNIQFKNLPTFYFRSILGNELHRLVCLFKQRSCSSCALRFQCAYSYIFESPLPHENPVLKGRNYASHPFVLFTDAVPNTSVNKINLSITLIGESRKFLPLIYLAIKNGGERGIFKARVKYEIKDVYIDEFIGINEDGQIIIPPKTKAWTLKNEDSEIKRGKVFIEFLSPFRYKKNGRLMEKIEFNDVLLAIKRRMEILFGLYMRPSKVLPIEFGDFDIQYSNAQLQWTDYSRYSARQKQAMRMGGVTGILTVEGAFDSSVIQMLKGAEIFHIGKNTSLGLGKIKVTYVEGETV